MLVADLVKKRNKKKEFNWQTLKGAIQFLSHRTEKNPASPRALNKPFCYTIPWEGGKRPSAETGRSLT